MKFIHFVDHRFQEVTLSMKTGEFSLLKDAETHSLQMILGIARGMIKWAYVPKILIHYFLVQLCIAKEPRPALDEMKTNAEAKARAAQAMMKSLNLVTDGGGNESA